MKKIDYGFGVSIIPIIENRDGLEYSDYEIKNSMVEDE